MTTHRTRSTLPLVYSCSGCSSAAQLANHVALQLDRQGVAEMSCIAGVGGDVPALLRVARSGRPIIALDGCPLACAHASLSRHQIPVARHYQLQQHGVRKRVHQDYDPEQAATVLQTVVADLQHTPLSESESAPSPGCARPPEGVQENPGAARRFLESTPTAAPVPQT